MPNKDVAGKYDVPKTGLDKTWRTYKIWRNELCQKNYAEPAELREKIEIIVKIVEKSWGSFENVMV